ncbi:MAG: hypothetical protein Q9164_001583 [Protoblastenia rupestris]
MDSRPYDVPLTANHSKKRSLDELNDVDLDAGSVRPSPAVTPCVSPKASAGIPMRQPNPNGLQHMQSVSIEGMVGVAGTHIEEPILQVDVPSSASQSDEVTPKRKFKRQGILTSIGSTSRSEDSQSSPVNQNRKIDEYARLLGISWAAPGEDPAVVASMRGFHRFIENNFPLTNVKIVAQDKKDVVNLVQASEGWFIFSDDLRRGQRLAETKEVAIANIKKNPVQFEGVPMVYKDNSSNLLHTPSPPGSSSERTSTDTDEGMLVGTMDID